MMKHLRVQILSFFTFFFLISGFITPNTVVAACDPSQGGIMLGDCLTLTGGRKVSDVFSTPSSMVNLIVANVMIIAGVVLFLLTVYAGFLIITGGSKGVDQAKQIMTTAVIGFVLMFSAYWIVQIIQFVTGTTLGV